MRPHSIYIYIYTNIFVFRLSFHFSFFACDISRTLMLAEAMVVGMPAQKIMSISHAPWKIRMSNNTQINLLTYDGIFRGLLMRRPQAYSVHIYIYMYIYIYIYIYIHILPRYYKNAPLEFRRYLQPRETSRSNFWHGLLDLQGRVSSRQAPRSPCSQ